MRWSERLRKAKLGSGAGKRPGSDALAPQHDVHIDDDGAAWELESDQIQHLSTEYHGADGARPYIKDNYDSLTIDGRIGGYLLREKLPVGAQIRSIAQATSVETAVEAIEIVKQALPIMSCIRSGVAQGRIIDKRSGQIVFGLPSVDVASGNFSASIAAGVWRVVRVPRPTSDDIEQTCFADVSAASGRVMRYGWL
jgi:hypothetical protein